MFTQPAGSAVQPIRFGDRIPMMKRSPIFCRCAVLLMISACTICPAFAGIFGTVRGIVHDAQHRHFPLELAGVSERVEVSENAQTVDTTSSASQTTLSRETITSTPGATRASSLDLITDYTPGAYMVHDQLHVRGGHQVSWLV